MKRHRSARTKHSPSKLVLPRNAFLILLPGACLLPPGAFIFRDFLFGNAVLLYKDIGSCSLNGSYPSFVHLSDYIRNEGFPSWSFYVGMGQGLYYLAGLLFLQPVSLLPRDWIAHALVYQHLAKLLIAGLLFFQFLRLRGLQWDCFAAGFHVAFLLRLHVHGQLLVFPGRRGSLFCRALACGGESGAIRELFRQSRIEGSVRLDQKSVLVVQTPFDRGWRAFQDGKVAPVLKADVGLLGVVLEPGEHKIELRYSTPFLGFGFVITLASCLLAASRWRSPRLQLAA